MNPIREARLAAGLTVRQLAERAGTSHSTVVAYETGRKIPRADTRDRLLRAAGWVVPARGLRRRRLTAFGADVAVELQGLLEAVDLLPTRHEDELAAPIFPGRLGS